MKKLSKLTALVLTLAMAFALASCGGNSASPPAPRQVRGACGFPRPVPATSLPPVHPMLRATCSM